MFHSSAALFLALTFVTAASALAADQVRTDSGIVEGSLNAASNVRAFKGIPFAAPPIGPLRWQAPQPVTPWKGVRKTVAFGARCMQGSIYSDMVFRDSGPSEDCLYLNVWTPAGSASAHLPVMVWIYGGGFQAGAASEPRQDGENLAKKGVVVVSMNYRLGIFGFFSHPELTSESSHHASGNYGLLDQTAALQWVHKNIEAFGGDPGSVTIFGESAGSMSVSAQMASPLAKDLLKQAIGESGAVFMLADPVLPLSETEQIGVKFAESIRAPSLQGLRAKPAAELLKASLKSAKGTDACRQTEEKLARPSGGALDTAPVLRVFLRRTGSDRFWPNVDGYFFPESPSAIYAAGKQAHVALLAGWNADEQGYKGILHDAPVTVENYTAKVRELYGPHAADVLKAYPADSDQQVKDAARDLASDRFIAYSTWKWLDLQLAAGGSPVFRYHFEQVPPPEAGRPSGAYHSADVVYVFETLDCEKLACTPADRTVSDQISSFWTNFAKTGNPNGEGLPQWPAYTKDDYQVMHLKDEPAAAPDTLRPRCELLDRIAKEKAD